MKKIKEYLLEEQDDLKELYEKIEFLVKIYSEKCSKMFKERRQLDIDNLPEEELSVLKIFEYLCALNMIGEYENILTKEQRGMSYGFKNDRRFDFIANTNIQGPVDIKPSGEESAEIHLWSGTSQYQEQFEQKHHTVGEQHVKNGNN